MTDGKRPPWPFDLKAKSVLVDNHEFNGVNARKSDVAHTRKRAGNTPSILVGKLAPKDFKVYAAATPAPPKKEEKSKQS